MKSGGSEMRKYLMGGLLIGTGVPAIWAGGEGLALGLAFWGLFYAMDVGYIRTGN